MLLMGFVCFPFQILHLAFAAFYLKKLKIIQLIFELVRDNSVYVSELSADSSSTETLYCSNRNKVHVFHFLNVM